MISFILIFKKMLLLLLFQSLVFTGVFQRKAIEIILNSERLSITCMQQSQEISYFTF